jgi:crotonobetainyl-CoA:carnitine CoA-transferase CaiB-like acyl-CoA transferase
MTLPLEGIRVLESAHQYPGPYCGMLLADMGAEVIKVERPDGGDAGRQFPLFYQNINRNKKSLTLNLKIPEAREILHRLIVRADVFTEGFRPGVAVRLGLDYPTLEKINPRLVYCSISGYGQEGPYRDLPGHDLNYQAATGMLEFLKDREGNPITPGVAIGDLSSGMFSVIGILAALMAREKTGSGQYIDSAMTDGLLSWMSFQFGSTREANPQEQNDPGYGVFKAGDGRLFTLGIAHEDWFWDRLCQAVGLKQYQGLTTFERRKRKKEIVEMMLQVFSLKDRNYWIEILIEADVPVAAVRSPNEVSQDPHFISRGMFQEISLKSGEKIGQVSFPINLSQMQRGIRRPPP